MPIATMRSAARLALVGAFAALSALARGTTIVPGEIPGQLTISDAGAAIYQIPLVVPPGVGGMAPKLALSYNSQADSGLAGLGWGLEGLSAIHRCPRTMALDGTRGSVNFDANDRFCLDGERLVLVAGSYGAPGSEYRTEKDSFARIVAQGSAGSGPASFVMQTKAGQVVNFGATSDSRLEVQGGSTAQSWSVNRIADIVNNAMTVSYTKDAANGVLYPSRIDYAGASVRFSYVPRSDYTPVYQAGSRSAVPQRLYEVATFLGESAHTTYRLSYLPTAAPQEPSQLSQIDLIHLVSDTKLPPTRATWSTPTSGFIGSSWAGHSGGTGNNFVGDFNGDGRSDLVGYAGNGNWHVVLSSGTGFNAGGGGFWAGHAGGESNNVLGDFNGDGLSDMTGYIGNGQWHVCLSNGTGFDCSVWAGHSGGPGNNVVADFDGDGRTDMAGYTGTSGVWQVCLSTGSGFTCSNWNNGHTGGTTNNVQGDFNGDGRADIAGYAGDGRWHVSLSTGSGFTSSFWDGHGGGIANNKAADFNGDGLTDLAGYTGSNGQWHLCLSTGVAFSCSIWNGPAAQAGDTALADLDGDGRSDMLGHIGNGVWHVCLSAGVNFRCEAWSGGHTAGAGSGVVGDFDGDGQQDLAAYSANGSWNVVLTASGRRTVTSLREGSGKEFVLTEVPLSHASSGYVRPSGAYPRVPIQGALRVVRRVEESNGVGGTLARSYAYAGLRAEVGTGRGVLGFSEVQVTSLQTGITTVRQFSQDWPFTGMPLVTETRLGASETLSRTEYSLAQGQGSASGVVFPYVAQSLESGRDLNGVALPTVRTRYEYAQSPQLGDPTVVEVGVSDGTGKRTVNEYWPASITDGKWILGRLKRATVTSDSAAAWASGITVGTGSSSSSTSSGSGESSGATFTKLAPILMLLLE